jgi:DNA-binding winged helix-turn-helix (wHTH) protein/Flp pilus assembly protein TadD
MAGGKELYEFGSFRLDAAEGHLLRNGEPVPLTPKAFDVLLALVEQSGRLMEKEVLLRKVWPVTFVEENNLADNISRLRKALGEGKGQKFIETVPKRGYRFVAAISSGGQPPTELPARDPAKRLFSWRAPLALVFMAAVVLGAGFWLYATVRQHTRVQQLVFKGDFYRSKWTEPEIRKAIEHYNQALAVDSNAMDAYAGLTAAWIFLSDKDAAPRVAMPKAKAAAASVLALDNKSANIHVALGVIVTQYDWEWTKAEEAFKRALELDPHHYPAHHLYGWYLMARGQLDEAAVAMRRALDAAPSKDLNHWGLGLNYYFARRLDDSAEEYRRAIAIEPRSHWPHMFLGWALAEQGRFGEALSEANEGFRLDNNGQTFASIGYIYALSGRRTDAERVLLELQEMAKRSYVSPYDIAPIYAALGDKGHTLQSLEKAYEDRSGWLAWWLKVDPRLNAVRSEPRFEKLLRQVGHTL